MSNPKATITNNYIRTMNVQFFVRPTPDGDVIAGHKGDELMVNVRLLIQDKKLKIDIRHFIGRDMNELQPVEVSSFYLEKTNIEELQEALTMFSYLLNKLPCKSE